MLSRLLMIIWGVLWTLQISAQYYSKTYRAEVDYPSRVYQILFNDEDVLCSLQKVCSIDDLCNNITFLDQEGEIDRSYEINGYKCFFNMTAIRNDTVFIAGDHYDKLDSTKYWKLLLTDINGNFINEYKYPVQHIETAVLGSFGYLFPNLYGLVLLKDGDILLWGEGLDKNLPGADKSPWQSVFLRVGLDGKPKGDLFWFEVSDDQRRMAECVVDLDGNAVFSYEFRDGVSEDGHHDLCRNIYKVLPNDSIVLVSKVLVRLLGADIPHIAVDRDGNYYVNTGTNQGSLPEYNLSMHNIAWICKVNPEGKELWRRYVPPTVADWFNTSYTALYEVTRITPASNGDVLCSGIFRVVDSLYNRVTGRKEQMLGRGSFIARFDADGEVVWRHLILPRRNDGKLRDNYIYDIKEAEDGSIVTGGTLQRLDGSAELWTADAWIMRLNSRLLKTVQNADYQNIK
ncbi:MAG: hypothetical protein LC107_14185, partial [Chitinophagales bacterium]|nr:hypothetical protein [Chitinophagales bacterium]